MGIGNRLWAGRELGEMRALNHCPVSRISDSPGQAALGDIPGVQVCFVGGGAIRVFGDIRSAQRFSHSRDWHWNGGGFAFVRSVSIPAASGAPQRKAIMGAYHASIS